MNFKILTGCIRDFEAYFTSEVEYRERWVYDLQKRFTDLWSIEPAEIKESYSRIMSSEVSKRYWKDSGYEPRRMMLEFMNEDAEYCAHAFSALFNESVEVDSRVDQFQFYAQELLQLYRERHPLSIDNNHYQDHQIISFYLSLRYPSSYSYFHPDRFRTFLKIVQSKDIPSHNDIARYFKIAGILMKFLERDEKINSLQKERLKITEHAPNSRWMVYEFIRYHT